MYGESSIREVELSSGKVLREKRMATQDFGEGLVNIADRCAFGMIPLMRHSATMGSLARPKPRCFCVIQAWRKLGLELALPHCLEPVYIHLDSSAISSCHEHKDEHPKLSFMFCGRRFVC